MPRLEILCGMIASGKSEYARWRADHGALVVAHDALTEMMHCRYRYEQEKRDLYRLSEEALVWNWINKGFDVVVDRTHLTREARARWLGFAKWPHFAQWAEPPVLVVEFPIEPAHVHAERRSKSDPRGRSFLDWHAVASHHAQQASTEPLDWQAEGFAGHIAIPQGWPVCYEHLRISGKNT